MKAAKVLVSSLAVIIGFSNKAALTRRHGRLRQKRGGTIYIVCHHEPRWQVACLMRASLSETRLLRKTRMGRGNTVSAARRRRAGNATSSCRAWPVHIGGPLRHAVPVVLGAHKP